MGQYQSIILAAPSFTPKVVRQPIGGADKYPGYSLAFQDDFKILNKNIWASSSEARRSEVGYPEFGGTNDMSCYIDESISNDGEFLHIDTKLASHPTCPGKGFTSGRLTSFGKLGVRPGSIIEASIKFPTELGMFPAFWMLPNRRDRVWPLDGEVDIMEFLKDGRPKLGTIHVGNVWPDDHWNDESGYPGGAELGNDFHTYTVEFEHDIFKFSMDGKLYTTVTKEQMAKQTPHWPFYKDDDFFIVFNAAVGNPVSKESRMSVDWLSIYTKPSISVNFPKPRPSPPVAIRQPVGAADKYAAQGYKMTFQDEFTTLNPKNWASSNEAQRDIVGFPDYGGNWELQCYIDDSISVSDGMLNIDTKYGWHPTCPGKGYTSGRLTSFGKVSARPGSIIEASIKFPTTKGMFPAFWLLPNRRDRVWPLDGEVDIMEFLKDGTPKLGTVHVGNYWPDDHWNEVSGYPGGSELGDHFHTYTVAFEHEEFKFYMDGKLYTTVTKQQMAAKTPHWPFDKDDDFFIIINAAVGADVVAHESRMSVDWLSIYSKK